jgi:hypothetical protein
MTDHALASSLAGELVLGALLARLHDELGGWELEAHWTQGEFHHDLVIRVTRWERLGGEILVVSTSCNGGVKEVLVLSQVPERYGLWRQRCPQSEEFEGAPPQIVTFARTEHWFDPCELLATCARSELLPEHRRRQRGGGWIALDEED